MDNFLKKLKIELEKENFNHVYIDSIVEYSQNLINSNLPVIFDFNHLCLYLNNSQSSIEKIIINPELFYKKTKIKSKKGKVRTIFIPNPNLKNIQKWILNNILYKIKPSTYSKGFLPRISIVDNALPHVEKNTY